jgi:hypothetical protein
LSTFHPGTSTSPPPPPPAKHHNHNNDLNNNNQFIQQTNTKIKISRSTSSLKVYDPETNDVREEILEETQTQFKKQQRSSSLAMNNNLNTNRISPQRPSRPQHQQVTSSLQMSPLRTQSSFDNISELYSNINVKTPSNTNPNNKSTNLSYNMNDLITDRIGRDFFTNVLGKPLPNNPNKNNNNTSSCNFQTTSFLMGNKSSAIAQTSSKIKPRRGGSSDGPIRTMHGRHTQIGSEFDNNLLSYKCVDQNGNSETSFWDSEENVAFRETLLTSDHSTLVTNDEDEHFDKNQTKKSWYSFKSAMSNNINDYIEVLDNNNYEKICSEEEYPKENDSSCTIINEKSSQQHSALQNKNQSKMLFSRFLCNNKVEQFSGICRVHLNVFSLTVLWCFEETYL